jgi:hypothetical protein
MARSAAISGRTLSLGYPQFRDVIHTSCGFLSFDSDMSLKRESCRLTDTPCICPVRGSARDVGSFFGGCIRREAQRVPLARNLQVCSLMIYSNVTADRIGLCYQHEQMKTRELKKNPGLHELEGVPRTGVQKQIARSHDSQSSPREGGLKHGEPTHEEPGRSENQITLRRLR